MSTQLVNFIELIGIFSCLAVAIELVNYVFVYRSAAWKRSCADLKVAGREWERLLATSAVPGTSIVNARTKAEKKVEGRIMTASREMYRMTMATTFVTALGTMLGMYLITRAYEGKVVATLPFEPFPFMKKLLQRGLPEGAPGAACSSHFVGALVAVAIRPNLQKLMGFAPSRALAKQGKLGFEQFASRFAGIKNE